MLHKYELNEINGFKAYKEDGSYHLRLYASAVSFNYPLKILPEMS